jgi:ribosomal-protein-serine acetyltransferase
MKKATFHTLIPLFEELRGERVLVRPYRESDAQALFEAVGESREHLRPWLPFADAHQSIEESRDWILHQMAQWLLRENLNGVLCDKETGRYLGGIGLHPHNWDIGKFEIGYWLRASAAGHGYMTEAVKLLTDYAFTHLSANRVQIRCDENNIRSAAIPRRLGFVQEACMRNDSLAPDGSLRTTLLFAQIRADRS